MADSPKPWRRRAGRASSTDLRVDNAVSTAPGVTAHFIKAISDIVGSQHVRTDDDARIAYGTDALKRGMPADAVVLPGSTADVAAVARLCTEHRVPIVPRGAGTGYTGGAVPLQGGV